MLARTSATLGRPLADDALLDVAATDALRAQLAAALAAIHSGLRVALQRDWFARETDAHAVWWQRAAGLLRAGDAWLLPREVETVGAIRVPAVEAWAVAPQLAIDNDDLLLLAPEARAGLRLLHEPDYAKYGEAGPWHLTIWGADWVQAAESAHA